MHRWTKRLAVDPGCALGGEWGACVAARIALRGRRTLRTAIFLALLIVALLAAVPRVEADAALPQKGLALIMVEEAGCAYCARWLAEVGPGYPLSDEGKAAPLHRRDRFDPEVRRFGRVVYTPTFVLIEDGEERGRILGYPGADFFWSMMGDLIARASKPSGDRTSGSR